MVHVLHIGGNRRNVDRDRAQKRAEKNGGKKKKESQTELNKRRER